MPAHGVIELTVGTALMLAPIPLGFGAAGLITSIMLGAILTGAAIGLTGSAATYSATLHNEFDGGFMAVAAIAALLLALAGDGRAALLLAAAALTQGLLRYGTRYVASG